MKSARLYKYKPLNNWHDGKKIWIRGDNDQFLKLYVLPPGINKIWLEALNTPRSGCYKYVVLPDKEIVINRQQIKVTSVLYNFLLNYTYVRILY